MSSMHKGFTFKQGDDIALAGTQKLPNPGNAWTASAALCDASGTKVADFVVTLTALGSPTATATHAITLTVGHATSAALDVGRYRFDVRYTDGNVAFRSPTASVNLEEACQ